VFSFAPPAPSRQFTRPRTYKLRRSIKKRCQGAEDRFGARRSRQIINHFLLPAFILCSELVHYILRPCYCALAAIWGMEISFCPRRRVYASRKPQGAGATHGNIVHYTLGC
jgi:hypothetical protein